MSFSPGKADQPISIQTPTATVDGLGATSYSWAALTKAPTWAEYVPLRGTERIEAGKLTAVTEFKLRIRRDTRVTSACRVTHGGKTYRITGVEDNHREGSMILHCAQVV